MRSRTLIPTAGRVAAVTVALLTCAGLADAAGLPVPALGGAAVPPAQAPTPTTAGTVGGTPGPAPAIPGPVIRRARPISASPALRTIRPGATTTFTIRVQPARTVRHYRLRLSRAPKGVTLRLNHTRTRRTAKLTVRTAPGMRTGRHLLRISAWPRRVRGTTKQPKVLRTSMALVVALPAAPAAPPTAPPGKVYAAGDVIEPLAPGVARPVNLVLTNALSAPVEVTALTATVTGVTPPPGGACTAADFTTIPATLTVPVRLAAETSVSLLTLGIPRSAWPAVLMINRPVSQDGCKAASVSLRFDIQARGSG